MRDFVPVAPINYSDLVMVVHPSVPAKDLKEFIALAKAKPGKLNYASSGPGTPYHMAGELFKAMSGTDIVHVPHKASGEARSAVIGGHVQMMFDAITTMARERQGRSGPRARHHRQRSAPRVLPDVPTVAEAGVPGYEATIWLGVMAPAGTPKAIVDKLNAEINKMIAKPGREGGLGQAGRRGVNHDSSPVRCLFAQGHREVGGGGEGGEPREIAPLLRLRAKAAGSTCGLRRFERSHFGAWPCAIACRGFGSFSHVRFRPVAVRQP